MKSKFAQDYQISTAINMLENNQNNHIDSCQQDLTQIFVDLQTFHIEQQIEAQEQRSQYSMKLEGLTFEKYNPLQRVLILTTKKYCLKTACYSFDYNHYFQITSPFS